MRPLTRRECLAALAVLGCTPRTGDPDAGADIEPSPAATAKTTWQLGAQSYCFRQFDLGGALDRVGELGLNAIEIYPGHLSLETPADELDAHRLMLSERGVRVSGYGVVGFGEASEANRRPFELARTLGIPVLSADPAPESFDQLEDLTEEFAVSIAIHNHGPGSRYQTIEQVATALDGRSSRIGACVDTGHAIRSGVIPEEMIRTLGGRVLAVHLKDWIEGGDEQILGEGELDLAEVAGALREVAFDGVISLEYELSPEDPVPGMAQGLTNWRAVL